MSGRRQGWILFVLKRVGRALVTGLTALGSCTCAGVAMSAGMRMGNQSLDEHGDAEVRDEARRGIAELEAYLAAVGHHPARRADDHRRRRRRGDTS